MKIAGARVHLTLTVPTAQVPPGAILPVFQTLSDAIEADVAAQLQGEGKRISCRAGCGACCRQLVPITEVEARFLAELVEALPEPRRTNVRDRFAAVIRRLDEAGLLETIRHLERTKAADRESVGLAYFGLGIPCPFLDNESCSIHPDRPLVCREYLVTSPAENCARPTKDNIEGVTLPVRLSGILARFADPPASPPTRLVALPLALEWAATHPEGSPTRAGPEWVTRLFRFLSGHEIPPPAPEPGK